MNRRQKLVQKQFLNNEKAVIKRLEKVYGVAQKDINDKIKHLQLKIDELQLEYDWLDDLDPEKARVKSMIQSKIYQKKYQQALGDQIDGILKQMQTKGYLTISDYLDECYEDGFVGSLFDLHGQGIPLMIPLDQTKMVHAVQLDSKISHGLYTRLGEDVGLLKRKITAQVSRSIATGISYGQTAKLLAGYTRIGYNNAIRITRTEGHRIQTTAAMNAMEQAKDRGADVVKQWDATLDGRTRESHAMVDGEIRELNERFSNGLMYPGDPDGRAAEVINCRCALLQRARWALEGASTKVNNFTKEIETFDSPEDYAEFKKAFFSKENRKYMNYVEQMEEKYGTRDFETVLASMTDREYNHYSELVATNPVFYRGSLMKTVEKSETSDIMKAKKPTPDAKAQKVGGVDCWVHTEDHGFSDGSWGVEKTVPATVYTVPDGTRFIYPIGYDDQNQTLSPDMAIEVWNRVPENIRAKIQKTVEVVDYDNPQDAYWREKYVDFSGTYAIGGNQITFFRYDYHTEDYLLATYVHEGGHFIDATLPGASYNDPYSKQAAWSAAMAKDLSTSGKKSCTDYGENSPGEDFAESVQEYVINHDSFVTNFPERAKLLDAILK